MKKIYLIAALLVVSLAASAQVLGEGKMYSGNNGISFIPKQFTYDGKPLLFSLGVDGLISVYNSDIEKVREFNPEATVLSERQTLNTETKEWETTSVDRDIANLRFMDADENSYPRYDADANLTQTLFNTDEKFEYIRIDYDGTESVFEYDYDEDGVIDHRNKYHSGNRIGFSIVQEDGTVLQSIKVNMNGDIGGGFVVLKIDGKVYLVTRIIGNEYGEDVVFYLIDKKASSVKQVMSLPGVRVRPTIADRDGQVTVELDGDAREIQVVNAAGQTVKRIPVGEGQRQVTFSARGLNSGVNVVRATGHNAEASRKFIVK